MTIHKTILNEWHRSNGAKMTDFAGFDMPLQYIGVREEHQIVRNHVGMFDVSHMGEFIIRGKEALHLVQSVISNDASMLTPGQAQYSCLPNAEGGIVDDLLVYRLFDDQCAAGEQAFMLVVNASNIEKDFQWINSRNTFDTRVIDISEHTGLIAVQGPEAAQKLQPFTIEDLSVIPFYEFIKSSFAGYENVLISATGYTGSGGFEIYADNATLAAIWTILIEEANIQACGLGARDTLRLEMGYCLYGNDIDDSTSPIAAGLSWVTKLKKELNFPSKEIFIQQKKEGVPEKLVAFVVDDRRVPRTGYEICDYEGNGIGHVTSGTFGPSVNASIGMGYVRTDLSKRGQEIWVNTGRKKLAAKIIKAPFYKKET